MKRASTSRPTYAPMTKANSLTIGNFDGVHHGHQAILKKMPGRKTVYTFTNHPAEILRNSPFYRLTTPLHRSALLKEHGVDQVIEVPFTKAFSSQSPEEFLTTLRNQIPFTHLILGHDAAFGANRSGDPARLQHLAQQMGFFVEFLKPVSIDGHLVSSSAIRSHIQAGNLTAASAQLGRPYSIRARVEKGAQQGRILGFQTANLSVHGLCLPPLGVYAVHTTINDKTYLGVANLGKAPTLHADRPPLLEVHLIDFTGDLYAHELEIVFGPFLRKEKPFDSIEGLKRQISEDIALTIQRLPKFLSPPTQ